MYKASCHQYFHMATSVQSMKIHLPDVQDRMLLIFISIITDFVQQLRGAAFSTLFLEEGKLHQQYLFLAYPYIFLYKRKNYRFFYHRFIDIQL